MALLKDIKCKTDLLCLLRRGFYRMKLNIEVKVISSIFFWIKYVKPIVIALIVNYKISTTVHFTVHIRHLANHWGTIHINDWSFKKIF